MILHRRDVLFGAGCALALGTAEYLRPRRVLDLLGNVTLDNVIPRNFAGWSAEKGGDFVVPQRPGSLAERLYDKQVMRSYRHAGGELAPMMLVAAYGRAQSDTLQLHRPESCYPAVGFTITRQHLLDVPLHRSAGLPAVAMTAQAEERIEDIIYWTRIGQYLPQSRGQQQRDRLAMSMAGYVGDGLLVRASMLRRGETPAYDRIVAFIEALLAAVPSANLPALIGTSLAKTTSD